MKYISLGILNKNIIPIIIGCIFCAVNRIFLIYTETELFKHELIANIVCAIGYCFAVIPLIISKVRSKRVNLTNNSRTESEDIKDRCSIKKVITNKWFLIILTSIIDIITSIIVFITLDIQTNLYILNIPFICLISHFMLKIEIFKHHYVSIIIIIILGLCVDLIIGNIQKEISDNLFLIVLKIIKEIFSASYYVIINYTMVKKFALIYEITTALGIIQVIFFVILSVILYKTDTYKNFDDFFTYFDKFDTYELFVAIGLMIIQLGFILTLYFTNKNNSPNHVYIIYIFGQLSSYIINIKKFSTKTIFIILLLIIILFMELVFNEIIELNFWGLSANTKKNIMSRMGIEDLSFDIINEKGKPVDVNDQYQIELMYNKTMDSEI